MGGAAAALVTAADPGVEDHGAAGDSQAVEAAALEDSAAGHLAAVVREEAGEILAGRNET